jgi:hypothetical protein
MSNLLRNKTLKKAHDLSGELISEAFRKSVENQDSLVKFLDQEAGGAYKRQWHRLERGLRLNRLRKFSDEEAQRLNLSDAEKLNLYQLLAKSLDKKLLNSKTSVIYDPEKESITEIKGLVMHRNSEGQMLFQLIDKQKAVTFRRKKTVEEQT